MTFIEESILDAIDNISDVTMEASIDVHMSICEQLIKQSYILESCGDAEINNFSIFQEGVMDEVKEKGKDDNFVVKAALFLPRLLMAIVHAIRDKFKKRRIEKTASKVNAGEEVSYKALQELREEQKKSPIYKAIVGISVGVGVTAAGTLIFRIKDYSPAVEFKDDVNFQIARDASEIRVQFPFYKIDGIKEFNSLFQTTMTSFKKRHDANLLIRYEDFEHLCNCVVTNQARISERDFTIESWDKYYNDEICPAFEAYAKNVEELSKFITSHIEKLHMKLDSKMMKTVKTLSNKSIGDVELISKFNDKLHKVYDIIRNPESHSRRELLSAKKVTYEPLKINDYVDIYNIDTHYLTEAIRLINKFVENCSIKSRLNTEAKNSSDYYLAMLCLEKQFNCKIDYTMYDCGGATPTQYSRKGGEQINFYKNKGFDLGGAKVVLYNDIKYCYSVAPKVPGQMHVAIICHEIFHNIAMMVGAYGGKVYNAFKKAFIIAAEKYQEALQIFLKMLEAYSQSLGIDTDKHSDAYSEAEKDFKVLADIIDDPDLVKEFTEKIARQEKFVLPDNYANTSKKTKEQKKYERNYASMTYQSEIIVAVSTILNRYNFMIGGPLAIFALFTSGIGMTQFIMEKTNEETMCDMCAAMYKLPVHLKNIKGEIRSKLSRDAKNHGKFDVHATTFDRETMSYNIAKQLLDSGKIKDPDIIKYLTFIMSSNVGVNQTERILTKSQIKHLAPEFMDDFNKGLSKWLKKNNIPPKEVSVDQLFK